MKRLIIFMCAVLLVSFGTVLSGCQGGQVQDFGGVDMTASTDSGAEAQETSSGTAASTDSGTCDPVVITNTVIEVEGGGESLPAEPEGQTCLMSRVPDDVSFVFSVDRSAQQIVSAMVDNIPQGNDEKTGVLQKFMMPFDQLDLEEVVGFAKFKYVDSVMDKPSDACRECMKPCNGGCMDAAYAECTSYLPPPDNIDECAWDKAAFDSSFAPCGGCIGGCAAVCSEEKPEPESFGVLVRWLLFDSDPDGTQKLADLRDFANGVNQDSLEREIREWKERCYDQNQNFICDPLETMPTELKADNRMEVELIGPTVALVHSAAVRPKVIDPVRICKYVRFDSIKERPAVYGELLELKLLMKLKPEQVSIAATRDSRKMVAGIDLRDQFYRLYAGVVDKGSLATGAYLSSVINLGDTFGLELWKQMMIGLVSMR